LPEGDWNQNLFRNRSSLSHSPSAAGYFGGYSFLAWGDLFERESTASAILRSIGACFAAVSTCALCLRFVELVLSSVNLGEDAVRKNVELMQKVLYGSAAEGVVFIVTILGCHFVQQLEHQISSYLTLFPCNNTFANLIL